MRGAVVAIASILASFLVLYACCTALHVDAAPAVLAAVLAMTLSRRSERIALRAVPLRIALLCSVGLLTVAIGLTVHAVPPLGATLFCIGMFLSVWLRNFGGRSARIGQMIAMPFIAMLVVPVRIGEGRGVLLDLALIVFAGAVAVLATALVQKVGGVALVDEATAQPPRPPREGELSVPTRMAIQLLVALAISFAVGLIFIPQHWPWIVLTAYIVCGSARGRGDALYKGLLRFGGAIGGAIVASLIPHIAIPNPLLDATLIFAVLFLGLALRDKSYVYWAACTTLIFALLQGPQAQAPFALLGARLLSIAIGAIVATACAWFIFPIRTESVLRRRLADALTVLSDLLVCDDPALRETTVARLDRAASDLDAAAKPVELHRVVTRSAHDEHPAAWAASARTLFAQARALSTPASADARRAVGAARKAVGANDGIAAALDAATAEFAHQG